MYEEDTSSFTSIRMYFSFSVLKVKYSFDKTILVSLRENTPVMQQFFCF